MAQHVDAVDTVGAQVQVVDAPVQLRSGHQRSEIIHLEAIKLILLTNREERGKTEVVKMLN